MMMCYECGAKGPLEATTEFRPYLEASGLKLQVRQHVYRCRRCGAESVGIDNMEGLHDEIAATIIKSHARLQGPEVRFLRKHLGWSGEDFARYFQVKPETVSRWENGKQDINTQGDLLLRMCVARMEPVSDYNLYDAPRLEKSEEPMARSFEPRPVVGRSVRPSCDLAARGKSHWPEAPMRDAA